MPFSLYCFFENDDRDCFKVHSYCQCIITTVIERLAGEFRGCDTPLTFSIHMVILQYFSYYSVNSAIFLHPVAVLSL